MDDIIYIELQRVELLFKAVLTKYIILQTQKTHIPRGYTSWYMCFRLFISFLLYSVFLVLLV